MNAYTGEIAIDIAGERLTLVYDWAAISRLRCELSEEGQAKAMSGDLDALAVMIAAGLARHHKEWTVDDVKQASPAIVPATKAVQAALVAAHFGPDGVPQAGVEENPLGPPQIRLRRLWRRLLGRG